MRNNKTLSTGCGQADQLEAFLSNQLGPREEQQLTAHLESCEQCRRRLDELAAAPVTRTHATAFLKDDPFDRTGISSGVSGGVFSAVDGGTSSLSEEAPLLQPQIQNVLDLLNATDDPNMLGRLGTYEVSGVVGSGGMGIVLKAYDRPLDCTVAIKVMAPYLATSGAARQRFSREARAAAAVIHPNVIAIYGTSTDATLPYLVMPYVGGASPLKKDNSMHRTICCLLITVFAMPSAVAQTTKLKLLNPDGTAAADARAIAIMVPFTRVDSNLKELPSLDMQMPEGGGTRAIKNEAGAVTFDSKALAVVAQNQAGFAFIPLPLKSSTVKLKPWAKLKIDPTAFASAQQEPHSVTVLWENCFAGNAPKPAATSTQDDPFGSGEPALKIDWRFDSIVLWSLTLDIKSDQMVNVPPGEVTLMVSPEDVAVADWKGPFANTRFRPVRMAGGKQTTFVKPSCGTIQGQLIVADLPSWNDNEATGRFVYAMRAGETKMPEEFEKLFTGLASGPGTILDEFAMRYASEVGMRYRYGLLPSAHARVNDDGTFRFVNLPVGRYQLSLFQPNNGGIMPNLKRRGDADDRLLVVELTGNAQRTDIGEVEIANTPLKLYEPKQALRQEDPFGGPVTDSNSEDPFGPAQPAMESSSRQKQSDSFEAAEERIKSALAGRTEQFNFQGTPLSIVIAILQDNHGIPIRLSSLKLQEAGVDFDSPVTIELPSLTLQSALRHILSAVSDKLSFTIRDEMLLITNQEDAARDAAGQQTQPAVFSKNLKSPTPAELDNGADFIKQWLKTAKNSSDQAALRTALQAHLEKEFDANQKTSRSELTRLQELLKQSEAWLDTRQTRRAEIVGQRLNELLLPVPGGELKE